ncbi:MAG: hypothetical protein ACRD9L_03010, partial [Bryobacteraceae bacterium]
MWHHLLHYEGSDIGRRNCGTNPSILARPLRIKTHHHRGGAPLAHWRVPHRLLGRRFRHRRPDGPVGRHQQPRIQDEGSKSCKPERETDSGVSSRRIFAYDARPICHPSAPRLGLAEAIVDLVSTGSTLAMNGLRAIADVLESEAILVANPDIARSRAAEVVALDTMIGAVIAARDRKYVLMNA